jgi:hypothetical protein
MEIWVGIILELPTRADENIRQSTSSATSRVLLKKFAW